MTQLSLRIPLPTSRKEAKKAGTDRYFTGKLCPKGHMSERYTSWSSCVECTRLKNANFRWFQAERHRELVDKWRANPANKPKIDMYAAKVRSKNREKFRLAQTKYRLKNPEKIRISSSTWYEKNAATQKEKAKIWAKTHRIHTSFISARRRSLKRSSVEQHTKEELLNLLKLQGYKCANCEVDISVRRHADHINPLSKGGSNSIRNMQWLCPRCNLTKRSKDPIDWAREQGKLL